MSVEMIQAIRHDPGDNVAVVVVEGVEADQALSTWIMEGDGRRTIVARQRIPVGHKIAVNNILAGSKVVNYGATICVANIDILVGDHVYIHNIDREQ